MRYATGMKRGTIVRTRDGRYVRVEKNSPSNRPAAKHVSPMRAACHASISRRVRATTPFG